MSRFIDTVVEAPSERGMVEVRATRIEDFVARGLLPFVGGHVYLAAILRLYDLRPADSSLWAALAALVGLGLVLSNLGRHRQGGLLVAVGASSLLIAMLIVLPVWLGAVAAGIAPIVYAATLATERINGRGSSLFLFHLPFISLLLLDMPPWLCGELVIVSLLIAALMLIASKHYQFSASALAGGLVGIVIAQSEPDVTPALLIALVAFLSVVALAYEWRLDRRYRSDLRRAVGQGLGALLMFYLAYLTTGAESALPVWVVLVSLFQTASAIRDNRRDPVRLSWPVIALVAALWFTNGIGDWATRAAASCVVVAALHLIALRTRNRYLYGLTVLVAAVPAFASVVQVQEAGLDWRVLLIQVVVAFLLIALASEPPRWRRALPAWRGFVSKEHWRTLGDLRSKIASALESAAFVGWIFKVMRLALSWLLYLKGGDRITLPDVVFVSAQAYGTWLLAGWLSVFAYGRGLSWPAAQFAGQLVWIGWGFALVLFGNYRNDLLARYVGLGLMCFQAVTTVKFSWGEWTDAFEIALLATTGATLAGYGAARTRRAPLVSSPASDVGTLV